MSEKKMPKKQKRRLTGDLFYPDSVVLRGSDTAVVYGCRRILLYAPTRICLSLGRRNLCVLGNELICTSFSAGSVTVEGEISGVRYCGSVCGGESACKEEMK